MKNCAYARARQAMVVPTPPKKRFKIEKEYTGRRELEIENEIYLESVVMHYSNKKNGGYTI